MLRVQGLRLPGQVHRDLQPSRRIPRTATNHRQRLQQTLDSPLIGAIADRSSLESRWHRLDRREQWRLFNVALWAEIYGVRA